jgi:dTMP kinase
MRVQTGIFLTIEGVEGVGKSTAVKCIQDYLLAQQQAFIITREPGGTSIAEQIRQILLKPNPDEPMVADVELLLMFASRAQHVQHLILPALASGKWVVSDRFVDASYAYQGGGRQIDKAKIQILEQLTVGNLQPNATILLDAPPAIGLARAKDRGPHDRIEEEKIEFFERVRASYLERAAKDPSRFHIIDATQPMMTVHENVKHVLAKLIRDSL